MKTRFTQSLYLLLVCWLGAHIAQAQAVLIQPVGSTSSTALGARVPGPQPQFQLATSDKKGLEITAGPNQETITLPIGTRLFTKADFNASTFATNILNDMRTAAAATVSKQRAALVADAYWNDILLGTPGNAAQTAFTNQLATNLLAEWGRVNGVTISAVTPNSGSIGTTVTITGTQLTGVTRVSFNGVAATSAISVLSPTSISVVVPTMATTGPVTVETPNGSTNGSHFTITTLPPTITSFTPAAGIVGTTITITGTNLIGITSATISGMPATIVSNTATQLTLTVPAGVSTGSLSLTTANGTSTSDKPFIVSGLKPASVIAKSGDFTLRIYGTGFGSTSRVKIAEKTLTPTLVAANELVVNVTKDVIETVGSYPVTVTGGGTLSVSPSTLVVTPPMPTITNLSPDSGQAGKEVTVTGTGLTGATEVTFNGTTSTFTVVDDNTIKATVGNAATTGTVAVTAPGGKATSTNSFTVEASPVTVSDMKKAVQSAIEKFATLNDQQIVGDIHLRGKDLPLLRGNGKAQVNTGTSVKLDSLKFSTLGGRITSIYAFTKDDAGNQKIFTNPRTSISLMRYKRRRTDQLGLNNGDLDYIVIKDLFYPVFRGNRRYIPDDGDYKLNWEEAKSRSQPLRAGGALSNLIEASLYSDALGVLNKEDNGIISTELASQIPLATDPIFRNSSLFAFQVLRLYGSFTRLDSRFDTVALRGPQANIIDRVDLLQRAYVRYGANLNLLSLDNGSHVTWHLNGGWTGVITRVSNQVGTDFRERNAYSKAWSLEGMISVRKLGNFGCDVGVTYLWWNVTNSRLISNNQTEKVLKPSTLLYYHPTGAPGNKLFLRFSSWNFLDHRDRSFLQVQFGYTIGIGALAKSFAAPAPQEAANRAQSSPVN